MARPGFMIWHEDGLMLKCADDATLAQIIRALIDYSTTGQLPALKIEGMTKALFDSMVSKINRDDKKYYDKWNNNTVNGFMRQIKSEAKAEGKTISKREARKIAEARLVDRYGNESPYGQQRLTSAQRSLTSAQREESDG